MTMKKLIVYTTFLLLVIQQQLAKSKEIHRDLKQVSVEDNIDECPENCSGHGSCKRAVIRTANDTLNGGTGEGGLSKKDAVPHNPSFMAPLKCECYQNWGGQACEIELNDLSTCPKRCSEGQGNCVNGKCHCFHPFSGEDCSMDLCPKFCSGHGKCADKGCRCFGDYTGEDCSIPMCTNLNQCNGHGKCNQLGRCECEKGFSGEDCNLGGCPDDCSGHGICGYGMLCKCDVGWSGENCRLQACGNGCVHGTCSDTGECVCEEGYRGESCEMRECDEPCDVHGTCDAFGLCKCDVGWEDKTCSTPICPLNCSNHGICSEEHLCECDEGYEAPFCKHKVCVPDKDGHICSQHGVCKSGECLCEPGWFGSACTLHECPSVEDKNGIVRNCSGHGHCPSKGNGHCDCDEGYVGETCSEILCPENCHNKGECVPRASGKGVHCKCKEGWKGLSCNVPECPNKCNGNGYCLYGSCYCYGNFTGPECNVTFCPNQCSQHGVCENVTTNPTCVCEIGWGDADCNRITCPGEETEIGACYGHGKCGMDKNLPDYGNCTCDKGWKGIACKIPACPNHCSHRGKCVFGECICQKGWKGQSCNKMDCKNMCSGHGTCEIKNTTLFVPNTTNTSMPGRNKSFVDGVQCKCNKGWGGAEGDCRWNITCAEDCNGNGDCLDGKCFCRDGWYGLTCKRKSCPNLCSGHGICAKNRTCLCQPDYTGESCETRRCPNNCNGKDHGICFNLKCICKGNYFGVDCSQKKCLKDCSNRGKCINGKCSCQIGYGGDGCDKRLCPGEKEPCSGRGKCDDSTGKCMCNLPWQGRICNVSDCYGHGEWNITTSICRCENGFKGEMCNLKACPINRLTQIECSGHGICNVTDGACECNAGFTGRNCEAPFVLLPRRNHSWKDGVRYGGNETIDSFARKIDALESAQLLNNTAVEEADADRVKMYQLNSSNVANETNYSATRSPIKKTGLVADDINNRIGNLESIDANDVESAQAVIKNLKLENEFANADYGPMRHAWNAYLHERNVEGMENNKLAYTEWSKKYQQQNPLRFKESHNDNRHMELVAEAISELGDSDNKKPDMTQGVKSMLRSQ